jgi:P pilus assembly chaperone PapD
MAVPVMALTIVIPSAALAAGIGVSPGKVAFNVRPGGTQVQTLQIINQDVQPSEFEVYIEGGDKKWFRITPGKFTLDGQGRESVEIKAAPPITASPEKEYNLSICIVSIPSNSDLRIGAGVKVPAHVQVTRLPLMTIQWWVVSVIILGCLGAGVVVWWWRRARYG